MQSSNLEIELIELNWRGSSSSNINIMMDVMEVLVCVC